MSAPISRVGVSDGVIATGDNSSITLPVPAQAEAGRLLVGVMFYPFAGVLDTAAVEADGWTISGHQGSALGIFAVVSRVCTESEPSSYSFSFPGGALPGSPPAMGAMFVLVNATGDDYGIATASDTAVANPFQTTTAAAQTSYADGSIMMCVMTNADGFTDSDDFDAHVEGTCDGLPGSMVVQFDRRESAEAVPEYSMQPVTPGGDAQWLQICLVGALPPESPKLTPLDPAGTIGLPFGGV